MASSIADVGVVKEIRARMRAISAAGHPEVDDTLVRETIASVLRDTTDRDLSPYSDVACFDFSTPEARLDSLKLITGQDTEEGVVEVLRREFNEKRAAQSTDRGRT